MHILRECPKTYVSQFSRDVIELYMYSVQFNNALPESGGILDQNALVMQSLAIVRDEVHKVERWREHQAAEKREKEAKARERTAKRRNR